MQDNTIQDLIQQYKDNFEIINKEENYKWRAIKHFQRHFDIDAPNFYDNLTKALSKTANLLGSGKYYPRRMIRNFTKNRPEVLRQLFKELYNEEKDIYQRILNFQASIEKIHDELVIGDNHYQDNRAVIVYLSLMFPDRYYLFKYQMFKTFLKKTKYSNFKPVPKKLITVRHFNNICDELKEVIKQDSELIQMHRTRLDERHYQDLELNVLTQDLVYAVARHLDTTQEKDSVLYSFPEATIIDVADIATPISDIPKLRGSNTNHVQNNRKNKRIGNQGEKWVIEFEKDYLTKNGRPDIANKVKHIALDEGDGLGYDILSYDLDENEKMIEVKTTTADKSTPFYLTRNELYCSEKYADKFYLYRVFKYNHNRRKAKLQIVKGALTKLCNTPTQYRTKI